MQHDLLSGLDSRSCGVIKHGKLKVVEEGDIQISDCKYLSSYSWLHDEGSTYNGTIVVPGSPNVFQDIDSIVPGSIQLKADADDDYSHAAARNKMFSPHMLPLFVAVNLATIRRPQIHRQPFDWTSFDFITDRSLLRKLHTWACSNKSPAFRIDMQLLGSETIVLSRYRMDNFYYPRSYGSSFEEMFTSPAEGCENTTTHHRIVSYDMEGLKMVVRFEVDAYLQDPDTAISSNPEAKGNSTTPEELRLPGYDLKIRSGGSWEVPQSSLVELKTTRASNHPIWKREYPQLFLSQTPHSYRAFHERGSITEVQHETLDSLVTRGVHGRNTEGLLKLRSLLGLIRGEVIKRGDLGRHMSLVCHGGDLKLHLRASGALIPDAVLTDTGDLFEKI